MRKIILSALVLIGLSAITETVNAAQVMSCSTFAQGPMGSYISLTIDKEGESFVVTAAAYNRTSRDVIETFIKTKVDSCEMTYTKENGKYFNCYKMNAATGMKDFGISNVYVTEHTLETIKYNLPRKSYRIEISASDDDKSIDQAKFKEIVGDQSFMNLAACE